nr:MAG: replication initiator protein [Microvirus sp.]
MCTNPVFLKKQSMFVPCRQCPECRLQRAKEWACRLHYELKSHSNACFITLTYDNNHYTPKLIKKDVQNFIKRLRYAIQPTKIKYFLCGEYGDRTFRAHYHAIIFGYDFPDRVPRGKSHKGYNLYVSPMLSNLWTKGFHTIQDTSIATCIYTALYTAKSKYHLPESLRDAPEFNLMSQNLGVDAIIADYDAIKQTDEIWIDGQNYIVPQAVLNKLFVTRDKDGCIVAKDDEYIQLKDRRIAHYREKYPDHVKLADEFIAAYDVDIDEVVDRIKSINRVLQAEREFRKPLDEKIYRQKNRCLTKTL